MTEVKWLHAPGHARSIGPKVAHRAGQTRAHVIDATEMYFDLPTWRATLTGYQHFTASGCKVDARHRNVGHDVVVSVRRDCKVIDHGQFFVAAQGVPLKYRPERHGVWVLFELPDGTRVLIVAWHPQPGRLLHMLGLYRRQTQRVVAQLQRLTAKYSPDLVLAGGDLQVGSGGRAMSPNVMARSLGMESAAHKIDWQMWSKGWKSVGHHLIDPSHINRGMDHRWMVRTLRKAAK